MADYEDLVGNRISLGAGHDVFDDRRPVFVGQVGGVDSLVSQIVCHGIDAAGANIPKIQNQVNFAGTADVTFTAVDDVCRADRIDIFREAVARAGCVTFVSSGTLEVETPEVVAEHPVQKVPQRVQRRP